MYIFKCKGTWIYSGQYNLYLSSTLIKNSIFCCVAPGHWDSRKIKFCAVFSKSSLFKIEYSINIETQCLKNIQFYSKQHYHIFTRKKCPLPMLPKSPYDGCEQKFKVFVYQAAKHANISNNGIFQQWESKFFWASHFFFTWEYPCP